MRSWFFTIPAVLLAAASCAPVPPSPVLPAPTTAAGAGTVLAVRPIVASAAANERAAWRTVLLNGASESAGPAQPAGASLAEFIVHEDAGATVSIVQSDAAGLHAGDRVIVTRPAAETGRPDLVRLL